MGTVYLAHAARTDALGHLIMSEGFADHREAFSRGLSILILPRRFLSDERLDLVE
jgi:hypothetical protein